MPGMPVADQSVRGGEDIASDVNRVSDSGTPTRITTAATTQLFQGRGTLKQIHVEVALTGTATVYDGIGATGTIITILPIGTVGPIPMGYECAVGCAIVTSATDRLVAKHGK